MRNALRLFIVGLMVFAMSFNPAMACHFCHGSGGHSYQQAYYGGGYDCGGGCGGCEVVVHDDCGGCGSCGGCEPYGEPATSADVHEESQPADPAPQPPADVRPELPATPPQQPATVERPVDVAPAPVTPVVPVAPAETTPPAATENLFDGTESTPPVETPTPPAVAPAETPAAPESTPAETTSDDELFGSETPAESTPPAETTPPAESTAPPEAATTDAADDELFGGTDDAATNPAGTEPAGTEPASDSAPPEEPAGTPDDGKQPAEDDADDDLFGASQRILREAGGMASNEMRVWVDNTGSYSVNARLVRFENDHVQLLKENGRTTTVPLNRLSADDLRFVNRQANAQRGTAMQTAQVSVVMPELGN